MEVTIQLAKTAHHLITYLLDDAVIQEVTRDCDVITVKLQTLGYLDIVSRYAKAPGVHSILLTNL